LKSVKIFLALLYLGIATTPLIWMSITSLKERKDIISVHSKWIPAQGDFSDEDPRFNADLIAYFQLGNRYEGAKNSFYDYLINSLSIGIFSTIASVCMGTFAAYGFSRFPVPGAKDWLFFILSTRFLPPLAVVVPVLLMFRHFDLQNTHIGLIFLYTAFNLSLAVWLMKGFIDEIPTEFEEAAFIDGYNRWQVFYKIVLPNSVSGIAVTGVFCLISAWNEYGFAMTLNNQHASTVPVYFAGLQGHVQGMPWSQVGAGMLVFVMPIVIFTVLVRRHLLRGVTFGTVKK